MAALLRPASAVLRDARTRAGLTQDRLAERAGVPQSVISAYENGRRQPSLETLAQLVDAAGYDMDVQLRNPDIRLRGLSGPVGKRVRKERGRLLRITRAAGMTNLQVFGSVARGEDRPDSDVDLIADFAPGVGLFKILTVQHALEEILHAPVDLAEAGTLKPMVQASAEREAIYL